MTRSQVSSPWALCKHSGCFLGARVREQGAARSQAGLRWAELEAEGSWPAHQRSCLWGSPPSLAVANCHQLWDSCQEPLP